MVRNLDINPVDAGNVRLEGLYFDQVDRLSSRLSDSNTIRVGPAALRYPFPAPTGLVDYALTQPLVAIEWTEADDLASQPGAAPANPAASEVPTAH